MLSLMRKHAAGWMIKVVVGAISLVFILWGVGSFRDDRQSKIASVNGSPIYYQQYEEIYNRILDQLKSRLGSSLDENILKAFRVKQQALNQLIEKRLLLAEAENLNLRVTDAEVAGAINRMDVFKRAGRFDARQYRAILDRERLTPEQFETSQRESLLLDKLQTIIAYSVKISDGEALSWYQWQDATVDIDYVLFAPETYKDIKPSADEIDAYFKENEGDYKTDPKVKTTYLFFDPEIFKAEVEISDDRIRDYYDANPEEFETPKKVEVRHILIEVTPDADAKSTEKARLEAEKIMEMARQGDDFAALAKTHSQGPSKDAGGYLGIFERGDLLKPFADTAFAMKAGEVSAPVRTQFGWHIIRVEQIFAATRIDFQKAKEIINAKLSLQAAKNLAYDAAEEVYEMSFEGDDLKMAADLQHIELRSTDLFTRREPAQVSGDVQTFANNAFDLQVSEISDVLDLKDGYYILQVTEKVPARIPLLADVADRVRAHLIKQKQNETAKADARAFLDAVAVGGDLAEESKKIGLKPAHTGFFKRNAAIPVIGYEIDISRTAFQLSEKKLLSEKVLEGDQGYYVIRFRQRKEPDADGFEARRAQIKETVLKQKRDKAFSTWLAQLRGRAEIEIEDGFLE